METPCACSELPSNSDGSGSHGHEKKGSQTIHRTRGSLNGVLYVTIPVPFVWSGLKQMFFHKVQSSEKPQNRFPPPKLGEEYRTCAPVGAKTPFSTSVQRSENAPNVRTETTTSETEGGGTMSFIFRGRDFLVKFFLTQNVELPEHWNPTKGCEASLRDCVIQQQ